ncbi:uncharacterized protein [Diadema antillarum]|uniref:uncharacterized protein isoform X1 n=1 Tax=Diadema antillarum TaxID=105358 RepID=UPI003A87B9C6
MFAVAFSPTMNSSGTALSSSTVNMTMDEISTTPNMTTPVTSTVTNMTTLNGTTEQWMTTPDPSDLDCEHGHRWIRDNLGECLETPAQYFAFSVGIASIGLWFLAHILLFKSRHDDPDSSCGGLGLITTSAIGSVCNLIGASLCDQLQTQAITAGYLVFSDTIFFLQWVFWWNRSRRMSRQGLSFYGETMPSEDWKSPNRTREENATMNGGGGSLVLCLCLPWLMAVFYLPIKFSLASEELSYRGHAHMSPTGRKLLMVGESSTDNFGYALGFSALVFYSLRTVPTIVNIANHKTKYAESVSHHVLQIVANVCYFVSVLAYDTDAAFLTNALPWLLISWAFVGFSSIIIFLVMKNRGVGSNGRVVGRRRADGTFLLFPSEESLNSDLERSVGPRFGDNNNAGKLPSIKEEPHLEIREESENEMHPDHEDHEGDYDPETASIHSRASDFILDDDQDVYVREGDGNGKRRRPRGATDFDDDGLEWDFNDFRPKYTDAESDNDESNKAMNGSPNHHSFGVPADGLEYDDDWDEEKVLGEIERELRHGDEIDGDTISMEYDTADDDDNFQIEYAFTPQSP